jgi:2-polyprenyl-3-methyl-5-hydroxy-6-metoxy-1,4-benzoquinol methylase
MDKMSEMWDIRYSKNEYAYGIEPNEFLKETIEKHQFSGSILFAAEGEGRNAIFAAKKGLEVTAFDISIEGKNKADKLAEAQNVSIDYQVGDFFSLDCSKRQYDSAVLVFAHFPPPILSKYHQKISELIKSSGLIILEGFSKNHLSYQKDNPKVGGPSKIEMLFSKESILQDFPNFEIVQLEECEVELNEGLYHQGTGSVIRFIGRKK